NLKRLSGESAGNCVPLGFCRIPFENIVSHSVLLSQNCGGHIRRQSLRLCECGIITSKGFLAKARGTPFPWDSAESLLRTLYHARFCASKTSADLSAGKSLRICGYGIITS